MPLYIKIGYKIHVAFSMQGFFFYVSPWGSAAIQMFSILKMFGYDLRGGGSGIFQKFLKFKEILIIQGKGGIRIFSPNFCGFF